MRAIFILMLSMLSFTYGLKGQGCVSARHMNTLSDQKTAGQWEFSISYRWLNSDRHFRGKEEEEDRQEKNNEVINDVHSLDIGIGYAFSSRLTASVFIPLVHSYRSSLYEHDRENRYSTTAKGIGDMRVMLNYWLWDTTFTDDRSLSFGMGVKLPTGNYAAKDIFHLKSGEELRPVDQSIQPGDGGWGIVLQTEGYKKIKPRLFGYAGGFYLINPKNTNGTRTYRETLNPILENEAIMSVTDQYMARAGLSYGFLQYNKVMANLGWRMDGVPVYDLIGKSDGFRRPGYAMSVEPGATYRHQQHTIGFNLPIAVVRERQPSVTDLETGRHGDAAFADYVLFVNYYYRF